MTGFGLRLAEAKARRGPLCLGIDPHPELLRGWDLATTADGLAAFCDICVRAFADFAVVKPQVAFFESYGAAGFAVLERTIAELRAADVLVLADAKRGDIGATMSAYATAWVGDSPLAAAFDDAARPSVIFLGGGVTQPGLLEACLDSLPAGGNLVANAVTVESEAALAHAYSRLGGELRRFQHYLGEPLGGFTGWRPQLPVTQWSVTKR